MPSTSNSLPLSCFRHQFLEREPARWTRLDTGCDTALEWVDGETERKRMDQTSIGLSHRSIRYIDTCVQIGRERFTPVKARVHKEQIFPGEAGLLGNAFLSKFPPRTRSEIHLQSCIDTMPLWHNGVIQRGNIRDIGSNEPRPTDFPKYPMHSVRRTPSTFWLRR